MVTERRLHRYQQTAVQHLRNNPRAGLFLDMGLGKTAATLSALRSENLPALVVAPKRVAASVWPTETALWRPDLRCEVAEGTPAERARALAGTADIVSLGNANLTALADNPGMHARFNTVIIDELSCFKNASSQRWKALMKISANKKTVWGLTGTPAPNGLIDVWPQIALLDRGARLGKNISTFRSRYFSPGWRLPNGVVTSWEIRPGASKEIYTLLDDICMSMSSECRIELPPVTYNDVRVELPPSARAAYKEIKRDLVADLAILGGEIHTAADAASITNRLSQISAGFMYPDDAELRPGEYDRIHQEKINAALSVVEETGSPVLMFYRYTAERDMLLAKIPGSVSIQEPDAIARWDAGAIRVLLAHPASAGYGLNLQYEGHTIVWTTLPWSLEEWQQGNKRLARQGQKYPVVIHRIMAGKTVDQAIRERLEEKASIQGALLQHLESVL